MKRILQAAGVLAIVVAGIAVFTFIRHYLTRPPKPKTSVAVTDPQDLLAPPLKFGRPQLPSADYDHHGEYDADFWYENTHPGAVEVGGLSKTCTCTSAELLSWPQDTWRAWLAAREADAVAGLASSEGPALLGPAAIAMLAKPKPVPLEMPPAVGTVSGGDGKSPHFGVIRLHWKAKEIGPKPLSANLLTRPAGQAGSAPVSLQFMTNVVNPLNIRSDTVDLGDINPGQERVSEFYCWSATHESFPLTVQPPPSEPNLEATATPVPPSEIAASLGLPADVKPGEPLPPAYPKAGYKVRVTLRERKDDRQLDIGPLARRIKLDGGFGEGTAPTVVVQAVVRGEFRIASPNPADRDRVSLGVFKKSRDASVTVLITGQPGQSLDMDRPPVVKPDEVASAIEAKLEPTEPDGGRPQWRLTVTVLGGRLFALPGSTAVELRIKGSGRSLRIPVTGTPEG